MYIWLPIGHNCNTFSEGYSYLKVTFCEYQKCALPIELSTPFLQLLLDSMDMDKDFFSANISADCSFPLML